jgi:hypothetical protein
MILEKGRGQGRKGNLRVSTNNFYELRNLIYLTSRVIIKRPVPSPI